MSYCIYILSVQYVYVFLYIIYYILLLVLSTFANQKLAIGKKSVQLEHDDLDTEYCDYIIITITCIIEKPVYTMRTGLINIPHMSSFRWTLWPWIWSAHIRTYPGSLSFFLLHHQSSTFFFFFIWYFLYTTTSINIDPRCPLHAAYRMPSYIPSVLYTHAFYYYYCLWQPQRSAYYIIINIMYCTRAQQ